MELKQLSACCSSADVIVLRFSCTLAPPVSCSMKSSVSASQGEKVHGRPLSSNHKSVDIMNLNRKPHPNYNSEKLKC